MHSEHNVKLIKDFLQFTQKKVGHDSFLAYRSNLTIHNDPPIQHPVTYPVGAVI
jgi:hypothetical protein